jgi:hypothetical protein
MAIPTATFNATFKATSNAIVTTSAAAFAAVALIPSLLAPTSALAQQQGYGQTLGTSPLERQMYDGGSKGSGSGSPLESGNPLDIMNAIRRNSSLSDATPPASAIDDALKEFDSQSPAAPGPAGLKPPGP